MIELYITIGVLISIPIFCVIGVYYCCCTSSNDDRVYVSVNMTDMTTTNLNNNVSTSIHNKV